MLLNGTFASLLAVRLKHFVELCMALVNAVIVKDSECFCVCVFTQEDPDAVNYRKQLIRNMQSKAMK